MGEDPMPAPMRFAELLREAAACLGEEGRAEAIALLAFVLGRSSTWVWAHGDETADAPTEAGFRALVAQRQAGVPIAHLTGRRGFWRFELAVSADTLIPRPETECLVERALERLPVDRPLRLLDLGTGSGAIALALAFERPLATVLAIERSSTAATVARRNAAELGLTERVEVREGDWFEPVAGACFDLIASNPPYIEADDPHLDRGDLRFEPRTALVAGPDGLDELRAIIDQAAAHLVPGGWLLLEHGWQQGPALRALFSAAGFGDIATARDLEDRERVTLGRVA